MRESVKESYFFLFFMYLRSVNFGCGLGRCDKSQKSAIFFHFFRIGVYICTEITKTLNTKH